MKKKTVTAMLAAALAAAGIFFAYASVKIAGAVSYLNVLGNGVGITDRITYVGDAGIAPLGVAACLAGISCILCIFRKMGGPKCPAKAKESPQK